MKKLTRTVQNINAEVIGLDVHKTWTVYSHLARKGNEVATGKFRSQRADLVEFIRKFVGRKKTHIVFEASRCSLWVFKVLEPTLGRERIHVAQAHKIRAIANSRQKNDENDSWWLAYLTKDGRIPEAHMPSEAIRISSPQSSARISRSTP